MLHHDVATFQRHAKPTAKWDAIVFNQVHFYEQEVVNLDSSRDSIIVVEQQHEQGPLDDAPAPVDLPSTPETPKQRVTYRAEDIRYKTPKRTDRAHVPVHPVLKDTGHQAQQGAGEEVPLLEAVQEVEPRQAQQTLSELQVQSREATQGTPMTEVRLVLKTNKEKRMLKATAVQAQFLVTLHERGKPKLIKRTQLSTMISKVR